ncbi:helix-turn-helix domain-containing protein [Streptomyces sp. NPDC059650]|uniref:helix-turn-helix domain-containing protein n=2 Tax=unclassified Streptomyces TaxID=2593676 RepID=UPI0036CA8B7B
MRYPQGGGLTAERQAFRERVRMEAVAMFAAGRGSSEVAKELRVSVRSVQRWRQAWRAAGQDGVRSRGPASRPRLSDTLFAVLEEELPSSAPSEQGAPPRADHFRCSWPDPSGNSRRPQAWGSLSWMGDRQSARMAHHGRARSRFTVGRALACTGGPLGGLGCRGTGQAQPPEVDSGESWNS